MDPESFTGFWVSHTLKPTYLGESPLTDSLPRKLRRAGIFRCFGRVHPRRAAMEAAPGFQAAEVSFNSLLPVRRCSSVYQIYDGDWMASK